MGPGTITHAHIHPGMGITGGSPAGIRRPGPHADPPRFRRVQAPPRPGADPARHRDSRWGVLTAGPRLDATTAHQPGLVGRVCPDDRTAQEAAVAIAARLRGQDRDFVTALTRTVRSAKSLPAGQYGQEPGQVKASMARVSWPVP
jgi:enoyl-CoA hydratase/carnithine racemase